MGWGAVNSVGDVAALDINHNKWSGPKQGLDGCSMAWPEQPLTAFTQKTGPLIGTNWQCLCGPVLCAWSWELIVMPNDPPG